MKKTYYKLTLLVTKVKMQTMICVSRIAGIEGTGAFNTNLIDDVTDEYLSRRRNNVWEEEDDDY